jgi:rubrerythrin
MDRDEQRAALASEFERHAAEEEEILEEYHELLDRLPQGPLSILVNQIATEEEMHHFLLSTLTEWLRAPVGPDPAPEELGMDSEKALAQTRALRKHEQTTIEACGELKSQLSGDEGEILEAFLDVLITDSKKHHRLLTTLEKVLLK